MPRNLFGELVNPSPGLGSRSKYAVPLSMAAHVAAAAVAVIVPLLAADVLPAPRTVMGAFTTPMRAPAPPPPPPVRSTSATPATRSSAHAAPRAAADAIAPEPETTASAVGDARGVPDGLPGGVVGSVLASPEMPLPPPPPPVTRPVPVGGRIKAPAKVHHVPPVYPPIAQQARVEGVVIIEAVVGTNGRVTEARVLRSKALLDEAALAAVRQWVFTPTTLNGLPVPVIMTVTVNFTLR